MTARLSQQEFWTAADQAELELLAHEFTETALAHRERCTICSQGGPWCDPLEEVFEAILRWRAGRILQSKAAWLRARQWLREAEVEQALEGRAA